MNSKAVKKNTNDPPAVTPSVRNPAGLPHGTTQDQINEMESEGQAATQGQRPNPSRPRTEPTPMPSRKEEKPDRT
jgi:hypothetical protein